VVAVVVDALNAVVTVMTAFAPIVFDAMTRTSPAAGPDVMWIRYPARFRTNVRFVLIVVVEPFADAVPDGPMAVHAPCDPNVIPDPPRDGFSMLWKPSVDGLYRCMPVALAAAAKSINCVWCGHVLKKCPIDGWVGV
jgi:hypothetical protein